MTVGETRTFKGDGIELDGIQFLSDDAKGTVFFQHGFSAKWEDYNHLIAPLAEHFNIVAYNQRGHGSSPGKFHPNAAVDDLEAIIDNEGQRPAGILGQSLGAYTAIQVAKRYEQRKKPVSGIYMLSPFLGTEFFPFGLRVGAHTARVLAWPLWPLDKVLNWCSGWREQKGFNNRDIIYSFGTLAGIESDNCKNMETDFACILTAKDEVMGTGNQQRYFKLRKRLDELFPRYRCGDSLDPQYDDTTLDILELNHCLNRNQGDFRPYMRPEEGKHSGYVLQVIERFFSSVFEKH